MNISILAKLLFILSSVFVVFQFYSATKKSTNFIVLVSVIASIQLVLGFTNFYANTSTVPPRFFLLLAPAILITIVLFVTKSGLLFLDSLDVKKLSLLHVVRVPVELGLYLLFLLKGIPEIMTFEGRNFDILAGITAPIVYYFGFVKNKLSTKFLLLWNVFGLLLLLNIVVTAVLSVKSSFQQFALNNPATAIAYFPYNWLPSIIVPLVLLSHLVCVKKFSQKN
jgi:hypothetical protein